MNQWISRWSSFFPFVFWCFGYWPLFARIWLFENNPALETSLYARFLLDRFCAGYDSASQAGGGTEEPIYSQALLLEPRHGLPPPPPQIALRFAAQINLEGQQTIQATALWAVCPRLTGPSTATVRSRKLRFISCSANYFGTSPLFPCRN